MALLATTSFQGPRPIEDNRPIKMVLKMTHYLTHPVYYSQGDVGLIDFILGMPARHIGMFKDNLTVAVDPIVEVVRTIDGEGSTVRMINDRINRENEKLDAKRDSAQ